MHKKEKKIIIKLITMCIFIGLVYSFTFANLFSKKKDFSENENRALAPFPALTIHNIFGGNFDDQFEKWFADHFFARDTWIESKAILRKATGTIENNDVYFAKNDRLIQKFSNYDEKTVKNNIQYVNEFAKENNLTANILLVPGAAYGAKDTLPTGAYNLDEKQFIKEIGKKFPDQNFLDITDSITSNGDYYFKTDHHWNEKGAYVAYKKICTDVLHNVPKKFSYTKVADDFKGTMYSRSGAFWTNGEPIYRIDPNIPNEITLTLEDGTTTNSLYFDENLKKKDKYTYYLDGNHAFEDIKTSSKSGKTAVIVKDSYSHILIPYLAQEYSEIKLIDLRYFRNGVSNEITDPANTDFYLIYSLDTFVSDTNLAALW